MVNYSSGYDKDGNPIDFVDEKGMKWIYQGKSADWKKRSMLLQGPG